MSKIYLDASVIIAALISSSGGSSRLIELGKLGVLTTVTSQTVIQEVLEHKNIVRKTQVQIENFVKNNAILVREKVTISEIEPYLGWVDPEDAHVVVGALQTKCSYLATLDKKHLLKPEVQKRFESTKIATPKEILASIFPRAEH